MNYIILLWEDMKQLCSYLNIEDSNPNAVYLVNRSMQMGDGFYYKRNRDYIYIHTPQAILKAERFTEDERDIFVKKEYQSELELQNYANFRMIFRNTHEKILCYDERVSIVGSFNYFSYDGGESCNYEGTFFRKEGAALIEDEKFARELIQIIMK